MAGGAVVPGDGKKYEGEMTSTVVWICILGATGGLIFGYDIGISGGVTSMDPFLKKFFRHVYHKMKTEGGSSNEYCKFNSPVLQLFTSSLYIAALVSAFAASRTTRLWGRRISMLIGGAVFLVGAVLNALAVNVAMLIIGRLLLGVGVGYANQAVPLYLSEMAPSHKRGLLNMLFQLMITVGILIANVVNYFTAKIKGGQGWRWSLGLAVVPAFIITISSFFLSDTPNSIIERHPNEPEKARKVLRKIRGTDDVEEEFKDIMVASQVSQTVKHPWRNIRQRKYRPQLIMAILIPTFQQLTGINVVMFYAPVLFKTLGLGDEASLLSSVITGVVNMFATFISIATVDKIGRRVLFLEGGIQMFISQILVGVLIGLKFGSNGEGHVSKLFGILILVFICLFVSGFAWSWGPLGWLVPSEIFPLEIRSAGQTINVSLNMFFTFLIGQIFLDMLCHMKFGLFFFFAGMVLIMTIYIYLFLPETKGKLIDEMIVVWRGHWCWSKYVTEADIPPGLEMERPATESKV